MLTVKFPGWYTRLTDTADLTANDELPREAPSLSERIATIESEIDSGRYKPGPWSRLVSEIRAMPIVDRRELSSDLTRVSRKLHERGKRTFPAQTAYTAELVLAVIGAILLGIGVHQQSNLLVILAALIWTTAFQPLVKVGVGHLLGVGYEYAYLYGVEPRFKMRFGEYLAKPRYARLVLHLSGMIGSPLGAWLPILFIGDSMKIAEYVCWAIFWVIVAINVGSFIAMLTGLAHRAGRLRLADGSGGSAAIEVREALEI